MCYISNSPASQGDLYDRRDLTISICLGLALFFFYLLVSSGRNPYGDEGWYATVARGIVERGMPVIPAPAPYTGYNINKLPIGQSLLLVPYETLRQNVNVVIPAVTASGNPHPLAFFRSFPLILLPAMQCALICALFYQLLRMGNGRRPALSRRTALMATLCLGIASQLVPSSSTLFADTSAGFFVFVAIYLLVRRRLMQGSDALIVGAAWAVAAACLCKSLFLLGVPAMAAYALYTIRQNPSAHKRVTSLALRCAIPFLAFLAITLWYNHFRYGSPFVSGYHEGRDEKFGFSTPLLTGLYGIFFSSGRSIFLYSPPLILALIGARRFARRMKAEALLLLGVAVPVVIAYAKWWSWYGGWQWGMRFYFFLIPLLMWVSIPAWRWIDSTVLPHRIRFVRFAFLGGLLCVSLLIQFLGIAIHPISIWSLNAKELSVVPNYQEGVHENRDDTTHIHFIPEFSPVAQHAWLVWATLNREKLSEAQLAQAAPFAKLYPGWTPKKVLPYTGFDFWFARKYAENSKMKWAWGFLLLALSTTGLATSLALAWRPGRTPTP